MSGNEIPMVCKTHLHFTPCPEEPKGCVLTRDANVWQTVRSLRKGMKLGDWESDK